MCAKGVLYNKIDISRVGGKYLHTFNVHTQATYTDRTLQTYVESYVCRHEQVKEVREFVLGKLYRKGSQEDDLSKDIVMILGDFNVNASKTQTKICQEIYEQVEGAPEYRAVLPLFTDSYKHLIKALSSEQYLLVDLLM